MKESPLIKALFKEEMIKQSGGKESDIARYNAALMYQKFIKVISQAGIDPTSEDALKMAQATVGRDKIQSHILSILPVEAGKVISLDNWKKENL